MDEKRTASSPQSDPAYMGCLGCGYDLRASQSRCPECARPFNPRDPRTYGRRRQRRPIWPYLRWPVRASVVLLLATAPIFGPPYLEKRAERDHLRALRDAGHRVDYMDRCTAPRWFANLCYNRHIAHHFADAFDRVVCLQLIGDRFTDADFDHVRPLTHLRGLEILSCKSITDAGLERLRLPELTYISFLHTPITTDSLTFLAASPNLREIDLSFTRVTSLAQLRGLRQLESVRIDHVPLTGADLSDLATLQSLREFHANYSGLDDSAMQHIGKLRALECLDLCGAWITDAGVANVAQLKSLQVLHLDGCPVTGSGLQHLRGLPALRVVGLSRSPVRDSDLAALCALPALERLDLSYTGVTDACVPYLLAMPRLKEVDLNDAKVSPEAIAELKRQRPALRVGWHQPAAR